MGIPGTRNEKFEMDGQIDTTILPSKALESSNLSNYIYVYIRYIYIYIVCICFRFQVLNTSCKRFIFPFPAMSVYSLPEF